MDDNGTDETVDRVVLNLRVDEDVKAAFEDEVVEKFGAKRPYTGIELEREFRFRLDDGTLAEVWESIDALADSFGQAGRKEKNLKPSREDTDVVRYRVAKHIRKRIMSFANQHDFRSAGAFVESIMWSYANGNGVEDRIADRLSRIQDAADRELDNELDAVERRTKSIAESLTGNGGTGFDMERFEEAVKSAKGINSTRYVHEKYLPRVLDELGFTWHPRAEGVFIDTGVVDTDARDPRAKPYLLMDDEDRRDALRYAVFKKDIEGSGQMETTLSINEAPGELEASPQKKTIRSDFQAIANNDEGFKYVDRSGDELLAIDRRHLEPDTREQLRAIARAEGLIQTDEPADEPAEDTSRSNEREDDVDEPVTDEPTEQTTSWVDEVVSDVSHIPFDTFESSEKVDELLAGKIMFEKYANDEDIDPETGSILDEKRSVELRDAVTDDDLDEVRRELGLPETTAATEAEIEDEADEVFAALEGADRARADGGRPMK
jgi:hypothetical protein